MVFEYIERETEVDFAKRNLLFVKGYYLKVDVLKAVEMFDNENVKG